MFAGEDEDSRHSATGSPIISGSDGPSQTLPSGELVLAFAWKVARPGSKALLIGAANTSERLDPDRTGYRKRPGLRRGGPGYLDRPGRRQGTPGSNHRSR
jgi:hypothetical protein